MKPYVYCIINKVSLKCYVGKGTGTRLYAHVNPVRSLISQAIQKHGKDSFDFVVLEEFDTHEEAFERESWYIAFFDSVHPNGYNLESGGRGGKRHSEESRRKISDASKAQVRLPFSIETREKLSKAAKNRSPETRRKLSESLKGTKRSVATRKKLSEARKRRGPTTAETRLKLSEAVTRRRAQKRLQVQLDRMAKLIDPLNW